MSVVSDIFSEYDLTGKEDITKDICHYKIRNDNASLDKIKEMIKETMNPFDVNIDPDKLYNLGTGKAVSNKTEEFMLNIKANGEKYKKAFLEECIIDSLRFEKPIKRQTLHTFATESGKHKVKKDGKVVAACLIRDLFGSILNISLQRKIDMGEVLSYPLTPVPLSLCHVDGSIQKSQKSALLNYLESKTISIPPTTVNVTIVDAMFFLHLHSNLPSTFGGVARYLLSRIMESNGDIVHFVFDKWIQPSIKDCERDTRAADIGCISYQIKGANQKHRSNWLSALRSSSFKKSLMAFLVDCWQHNE